MIFSTYEFTLIFLPVTFIVYFVLHHFKFTNLAKL